MIDIGKILKRAWNILWNYKILWIFGILLALTAGGGSSANSGSGYRFNNTDWNQWNLENSRNPQIGPAWREFSRWIEQDLIPLFDRPAQHITTWIWIGIAFLVVMLIIGVIFTLIRYVSETAIFRMVDDYEQTGTKVGFRQGWKLGWSRRAFRIWVIDLIISLPFILFLLLLAGIGLLIYFSIENGGDPAILVSVVTGIGCTFLFIFFAAILGIILGLLRQFFVRAAALEDAGIGESFQRGWALFKRNWKSAVLMWLVMLGVSIGIGIGGIILFFILIPVYVILLIPSALVAAIPGLLAFGITSIFTSGPLTWIIAGVVALPFFVMVLFAPLTFFSGLYKVYESSVWTMTYREMKALEVLPPTLEPGTSPTTN